MSEDLPVEFVEEFERALAASKAEWEAKGFAPSSDPFEVGTLYRVPDANANAVGIPLTAKFIVIDRAGDDIIVCPFSIVDRTFAFNAAEVYVPSDESPYGDNERGALVVHLWCKLRLAQRSLRKCVPGARVPSISSCIPRQLAQQVFAPPTPETATLADAYARLSVLLAV